MKDILPPESAVWQVVENKLRDVFNLFGYKEIRTPFLENLNLFERGIGEATDIVEKEMYIFNDSKGRQSALRPEMTASVARAFIENNLNQIQSVHRLFYVGPMFRHERPQAGRLRQFHQFGGECIGLNDPISDVDVIYLIYQLLAELGITDFTIRMNSLGSQDSKQKYSKTLREYLSSYKTKLCDLCQDRLDRNVFRVLDCKNDECQALTQSAPLILDVQSKDDQNYFNQIVHILEQMQIPFRIDPRMVRGLDYYTNTVFEISHPSLGAKDALGAGGRYNNLIQSLGGADTPAIGFAVGLERLLMILSQEKILKNSAGQDKLYLVSMGEESMKQNYFLLNELRKQKFLVEMDMSCKNIKYQMKQANKLKANWCLIRGEDELTSQQIVIKNMDSGDECKILFDQLFEFLNQSVKSEI